MRAPVLLLLPGALLLLACSGSDAPAVQVAEVARATVSEVVDAPGTVTARATSTVTAPADGSVALLQVADGEHVRKGQVLLRLSSPSAHARLEQARSARAAAAARVELPRADLGPLQDQLDEAARDGFEAARSAAGKVPDVTVRATLLTQVEAAEARYRSAAAAARSVAGSVGAGVGSVQDALNAAGSGQRAQAAALVSAAQATVDALVVRAPQAGVVTFGTTGGGAAPSGASALLDQLPPGLVGKAQGAAGAAAPQTSGTLAVGVPVTSGAPLLTVTDVSGLGVVAEVDETDVLLVRPGVAADVELDALPDAAYTGSVTAVDVAPTAGGSGGGVTYRVRLSLTPGRGSDGRRSPQPRPGMSAVVDLRVREARDAVSVPSAALVRDGGKDTVYVQTGGVYRRREVVVGATGQDRVQVVRGLEVGERVVTRDGDKLHDGQPVDA